MENDRFVDYLKTLGEKPESYHNKGSLKGIIFNRVTDASGKMHKSYPAFPPDAVGKTLECYITQIDENTGEDGIQDLNRRARCAVLFFCCSEKAKQDGIVFQSKKVYNITDKCGINPHNFVHNIIQEEFLWETNMKAHKPKKI